MLKSDELYESRIGILMRGLPFNAVYGILLNSIRMTTFSHKSYFSSLLISILRFLAATRVFAGVYVRLQLHF